jgi:hypothetical protein
MNAPKTVTISVDTANAIVGYLGKKPFEEVFQLINRFETEVRASLAPAAPIPPETPPSTPDEGQQS